MLFRRMGLTARSNLSPRVIIESARCYSTDRNLKSIHISADLDAESSKVVDRLREQAWDIGSSKRTGAGHVPKPFADITLFRHQAPEKLPLFLEAAKAFTSSTAAFSLGNATLEMQHHAGRGADYVVLCISQKDKETLQAAFASATKDEIVGDHIVFKGLGHLNARPVYKALQQQFPRGVPMKNLVSLSILGSKPADLSISRSERKAVPQMSKLGKFDFEG